MISAASGQAGLPGRGRAAFLTVSRPELLVDGTDREFRAFLHALLAFAARLETIRGGFGKLIGLTGIQYTILISIRSLGLDGEVSVGSVASHLHLSGAFVTTETGKLARRGLILKRADPRDRRRVCLSLTRRGFDLLGTLAPTQIKVNDVLFECLGVSQFRQLRAMVDGMVDCADRAASLLRYLTGEEASRSKKRAGLNGAARKRG